MGNGELSGQLHDRRRPPPFELVGVPHALVLHATAKRVTLTATSILARLVRHFPRLKAYCFPLNTGVSAYEVKTGGALVQQKHRATTLLI